MSCELPSSPAWRDTDADGLLRAGRSSVGAEEGPPCGHPWVSVLWRHHATTEQSAAGLLIRESKGLAKVTQPGPLQLPQGPRELLGHR